VHYACTGPLRTPTTWYRTIVNVYNDAIRLYRVVAEFYNVPIPQNRMPVIFYNDPIPWDRMPATIYNVPIPVNRAFCNLAGQSFLRYQALAHECKGGCHAYRPACNPWMHPCPA